MQQLLVRLFLKVRFPSVLSSGFLTHGLPAEGCLPAEGYCLSLLSGSLPRQELSILLNRLLI